MNLFGGLQIDSAAQLAGHPFFTDAPTPADQRKPITVLYEQLFDIQNQIALKVGQIGIVTQVLTVAGRNANKNARKPYFNEILIVARTYENVLVNRSLQGTGQSASVVAEACADILHGWGPEGLSASLFCLEVKLADHPKLFTWDAVFSVQAGTTDDSATRIPFTAPIAPTP